MSEESFTIIRPFGPSIAKLKLPNEIILELNKFVDEIIGDEKRSNELDHGKNLAGNVRNGIRLRQVLVKSKEVAGVCNVLMSGHS